MISCFEDSFGYYNRVGADLNALIRLICCPNLPFAIIDALNCVIVVLFLVT